MPEAEIPFAELVEAVQVDVGKELGSEVAYRQAATGRCLEQALRIWKPLPVGTFPLHAASPGRVIEDDLVQKEHHRIEVKRFRETLLNSEPLQSFHYDVVQDQLVDVHEVTGNVHLQDITGRCPIHGAGA